MIIDQKYIENIWNNLQSSTNIISDNSTHVQSSWGLYIVSDKRGFVDCGHACGP